MKSGICLILIIYLFSYCTSTQELTKDRFSTQKKYAVIPFDCPDKEYGERLSKEVTVWLETFDYEIMNDTEFKKNLENINLTVDDLNKNYNSIVGKTKSVDAVVLGYIKMDKGTTVKGTGSSSGRQISFADRCDVIVVDITSGAIIERTTYIADPDAVFKGKATIEEVAKKIALQLSPH
ncbi:MAG: hypothetical protein RDU14_08835 [Melioribacteraceae bacterium]|nr:hypothetical protein [Melioribacteraceae bacterium]